MAEIDKLENLKLADYKKKLGININASLFEYPKILKNFEIVRESLL